MKRYIISTIIFCLAVVLTSCNYQVVPVQPTPLNKPEPTVKSRFSGDYEVLRLRAMWAVCAQSYHQKVPTAGPNYVASICDCYVDRIRANYSQKELVSITKPQAEQMGMKYIGECNAEFMDRIGRQQGKGQGTNGLPKIEIPESKYEI